MLALEMVNGAMFLAIAIVAVIWTVWFIAGPQLKAARAVKPPPAEPSPTESPVKQNVLVAESMEQPARPPESPPAEPKQDGGGENNG